jgi:hypothetical protein
MMILPQILVMEGDKMVMVAVEVVAKSKGTKR